MGQQAEGAPEFASLNVVSNERDAVSGIVDRVPLRGPSAHEEERQQGEHPGPVMRTPAIARATRMMKPRLWVMPPPRRPASASGASSRGALRHQSGSPSSMSRWRAASNAERGPAIASTGAAMRGSPGAARRAHPEAGVGLTRGASQSSPILPGRGPRGALWRSLWGAERRGRSLWSLGGASEAHCCPTASPSCPVDGGGRQQLGPDRGVPGLDAAVRAWTTGGPGNRRAPDVGR